MTDPGEIAATVELIEAAKLAAEAAWPFASDAEFVLAHAQLMATERMTKALTKIYVQLGTVSAELADVSAAVRDNCG